MFPAVALRGHELHCIDKPDLCKRSNLRRREDRRATFGILERVAPVIAVRVRQDHEIWLDVIHANRTFWVAIDERIDHDFGRAGLEVDNRMPEVIDVHTRMISLRDRTAIDRVNSSK